MRDESVRWPIPTFARGFNNKVREPLYLPPDQAKQFIADEIKKYRDIIAKAGIPQID